MQLNFKDMCNFYKILCCARSNSVQYSESDICSLSIQIFITNHDYPILVNSAAFWPKTSYCHTAGGLICGGLRGLPPTSVNI